MPKSPEAFRTISEVADELDVPKHVLRFWEVKFPQIRPMKRGGGRRYYRPQDLELLRGIRRLLQAEAYTIKGVQKILREQGIDHVKRLGLAPAPDARATRSKARRRVKAEAPAPLDRVARASGEPRADAVMPGKMRAILSDALAELRYCRGLLAGGGEPAPRKSNPSGPGA